MPIPQTLRRATAIAVLAAWAAIGAHALEHHAHGEALGESDCGVCAFFFLPGETPERAAAPVVGSPPAGPASVADAPASTPAPRALGRAPPGRSA